MCYNITLVFLPVSFCNQTQSDLHVHFLFTCLQILGDGDVSVKLNIKAGAFSASAKEKLEAAGCSLTLLPKRKKWLSQNYLKNQARAEEYFAKKKGGAGESDSGSAQNSYVMYSSSLSFSICLLLPFFVLNFSCTMNFVSMSYATILSHFVSCDQHGRVVCPGAF